MFERKLLVFWALVYCLVWLLRRNPRHVVARAAFTWIGPRPLHGETWARFQLRWALYSFGWLCQIALLMFALYVLTGYEKSLSGTTWFMVLLFGLPFGAGMATLATLGFLFKAAKAKLLGPNPSWGGP